MHNGPAFIGLGAQRTGSSWLYSVLRSGPDTWMPPIKELHYWDWADPEVRRGSLRWKRHLQMRVRSNLAAVPILRGRAHDAARLDPGFDRRYFTGRRSAAWYRRLFDAAPAGARSGEITPSYWDLSAEGIRQLRAALPEVRLVLTLRNPVERTWSTAVKQLARKQGRSIEAVGEAEMLTWLSGAHIPGYADAVERWTAVFPPGQLHIAWFDELVADPARYLGRILGHIGSEADAVSLAGRHPDAVNAAARGGAPPPEAVQQELASRLLPELDRLRSVLDDPGWIEQWQAGARAPRP